jgi:hypothetical protein
MSLREHFEEWCRTERNHSDLNRVKKYHSVPSSVADEYMNPVVELAWKAYQAGHKLAVAEIDARENAIAAQFFDNALSPTRKTPRTPINEIDY